MINLRYLVNGKTISMIYFLAYNITKYTADLYYWLNRRKYNEKLERIKKLIKEGSIEKIYINRADRIGDAIITLPFLLSFKKYIEREYPYIKIIVITSEYNNWVLKDFINTKIEKINLTEKTKLTSVFRDSISMFKSKGDAKSESSIYIDLKKDYMFAQKYCWCQIISYKDFPLNFKFSDYVFDEFYGSRSNTHNIIRFKGLIDKLFDTNLYIKEFPNELKKYIIKKHNPDIEKYIKNDYIIVYVGNKEFRNLSIDQWVKLINLLDYSGTILVVDDPSKDMLLALKNSEIKKENVVFMEESYDLWSLMYLAMHSKLVIGIDGGGFNFLQIPTNAFEIIMYVNENTWKPYSNNKYKIIRVENNHIFEKTTTSDGLIKEICYISNSRKMAYELMQKKDNPIKKSINVRLIVEEINKCLKNL